MLWILQSIPTLLEHWIPLIQLPKFPYLTVLRPRQWIKNLIVFAAPLYAVSIDDPLQTQIWPESLLTFVLFCSVSSSFYLLNDILDREADRHHPVKCQRMIAAGFVSVPVALAMAITLFVSALSISYWHTPPLGILISGYALLQIAYNLWLKRTAILDIMAIATGFILRASAGAVATGTTMSSWFLLCTAMLALFLGIEKRKAELRLFKVHSSPLTRAVLERYSLPLLLRMESTVTTGIIMSYALWSSGPTVGGAPTAWMLLTLPFVLYGVFRYQLLSDPQPKANHPDIDVVRGRSPEQPEEVLLKDTVLLLTLLAWIGTSVIILGLKQQGVIV